MTVRSGEMLDGLTEELRVLLVNVSMAGDSSGTGHTLGNLFGGMPQESMMQLSLQLEPDTFHTTVENTRFINERSIRTYLRIRRTADAVGRLVGAKTDSSQSARTMNSIRQVSGSGRGRSALSGFLDMTPCTLTEDIMEEIRRFAPTVIYTAGSSVRVHSVANRLAGSLDIPLVLHLMDDWPETAYRSTLFARVARAVLLRQLARTNELSFSNFAISAPLCDKYRARYGKEYLPLMNPAVEIVDCVVVHHHKILEFVYAGSIGLGRHESLLEIGRVIAAINTPEDRAHLTLYIPDGQRTDALRAEFCDLGATVHGYLPVVELRERLAAADVLIHVESFRPEYREFARYSLSTKIPECMGAGKPILAFLPDDLYGSEYIRSRKCGVVASNPSALRSAVDSLVRSPDLRRELASAGVTAARDEHSVAAVRARLVRTLAGASSRAQLDPSVVLDRRERPPA